jgi:hypothetical protein
MSTPSRPRRKSKLIPFTVDELLDNPAMTGFVSFLDVHPEQRTSLPQASEEQPVASSLPDGRMPPGSNLPPGGTQPPESTLLPDSTLTPDRELPSQSKSSLLSDGNLTTDSNLLPGSSFPPDVNLLPDSRLHPGSDLIYSPLPGAELRTPNGRTVRIREARSVQDAHTSAEYALLQLLWEKGTGETATTRLVKAGLGDVSKWTGAHKTSCRAYLRALAGKLAIEEAETFDAAAGKEGARVYRVFSAEAILDRRRKAGFTHVIRTGAVSFVDPRTGSKLLPGRDLT